MSLIVRIAPKAAGRVTPVRPLAGKRLLTSLLVMEAADMDDVIRLVAGTPAPVRWGAIEIRPIMFNNDEEWRSR